MRRICAFVLLGWAWVGADAQSVLIGDRLVSKGDAARYVRDIAGAPEKVDKIPQDEYSPAMEIWSYRRNDRAITLWVVADKVVQAQESAEAKIDAQASH
jgi:hypothetical protein